MQLGTAFKALLVLTQPVRYGCDVAGVDISSHLANKHQEAMFKSADWFVQSGQNKAILDQNKRTYEHWNGTFHDQLETCKNDPVTMYFTTVKEVVTDAEKRVKENTRTVKNLVGDRFNMFALSHPGDGEMQKRLSSVRKLLQMKEPSLPKPEKKTTKLAKVKTPKRVKASKTLAAPTSPAIKALAYPTSPARGSKLFGRPKTTTSPAQRLLTYPTSPAKK